jgi:hypothetical protein
MPSGVETFALAYYFRFFFSLNPVYGVAVRAIQHRGIGIQNNSSGSSFLLFSVCLGPCYPALPCRIYRAYQDYDTCILFQ